MSTTEIAVQDRKKQDAGWRAGKPVEDPDKIKRWGFISARPSEYLIHVRRGEVRRASSGQGASCFKLPGDGVAIVPTSLQQLSFVADQVTLEKTGVEVHGLAVYRIAEPLIAYRVLNFSYPERAQEKLEQTLTAMFVGAARRLIANLTVEECLQKRKTALAAELMREVAPVVSGEGSPDDTTDRGWGIVIDTIEIQEVRILSASVFSAMQAPFRAALDQRAREARAETEMQIAAREAACGREVQEARITAEESVELRRRALAAAAAETRRIDALREAAVARELEESRLVAQAAVRERQAELARREAEAQALEAIRREERAAEQARAEVAAHAARAEAAARRVELGRAELLFLAEKRRVEAELALLEGRGATEVALSQARANREAYEGQARLVLAEKLPQLAAAVGAKFGEVKVTQIGGEASPFGSIAQALASVVELVRDGK